MPLHTFKCENGDKVDLLVSSIDEGMKQSCPECNHAIVAFASQIATKDDSIRGGVNIPGLVNEKGNCHFDSDSQFEKAKTAHGLIQNEAGLDRDINRYAEYKKQAQRERITGKLEKMVADIPAGYRIKTV